MIDRKQLLKDLQGLLPSIEQDILVYTESKPELNTHLKDEYAKAKEANRTAEHFLAWREAQITQAAVAWILTCVFVRFLEDNELLDEPLISGPAGSRLQHAKDRLTVYFRDNPTHAEREYLLSLFEDLEQLPVMAELLDHRHNPLWQLPVSADGARRLIDFFQQLDAETGDIVHDFTDEEWDTRFLGDLYQDLSESVRKRYALLQTPEFVESFILDYTLEKAKETFGLPGLRLIDPTCGSGHFLLTTFERLFNDWVKREPSTNSRALAQRALDSVYGVDINPYAIAIARFRLLIAAMKTSGSKIIKNAPDFHFNLACGDSLIHGRRFEWQGQGQQTDLVDEDPIKHALEVEDQEKLKKILGQQYHAVVGNPPYIIVKDKALNQAYRDRYLTCYRKYSLCVPFMERFFELTLPAENGTPCGYMGQITTNAFLKRELGKKLIEDYLPKKDLTHIIDTSGAFIPGHATPTIILFARNQKPNREKIRVVMGIRAESATPSNPENGSVWSSIRSLIEHPNSDNDYVAVADKQRELYSAHPWNLVGGGAIELKKYIEVSSENRLSSIIKKIGFGSILGEEEAFLVPNEKIDSSAIPLPRRRLVAGLLIRDWVIDEESTVLFPYDSDINLIDYGAPANWLWRNKTVLWNRPTFNKIPYRRAGRTFIEYHQIHKERNKSIIGIVFAFVASHNHFSVYNGEFAFSRSAPLIHLNSHGEEIDYQMLCSYLNSSICCFWLKQVSHQKQMSGGESVRIEFVSKVPYEFAGTQMENLPLPSTYFEAFREKMIPLATIIFSIVKLLENFTPKSMLEKALSGDPEVEIEWNKLKSEKEILHRRMVLLQEQMDWICYEAFGLCDGKLIGNYEEWLDVGLSPGQRPFEIRAGLNQDGFYAPKELPSCWPESMKNIWRHRIKAIDDIHELRVIEDPNYKRRWVGRQGKYNRTANADLFKDACAEWLLTRVENVSRQYIGELKTVAQLYDALRADETFRKIAACLSGSEIIDTKQLIAELVSSDTVPLSASFRLKTKAIPKFRAWQETWEMQRREDVIDVEFGVDKPLSEQDAKDPEKIAQFDKAKQKASAKKAKIVGDIPVPPKYASSDFRKGSYWPLRGKLDVPKERFFSLPGCEKDGDSTLVVGWAGMNHLQRAQAIATWYLDRKEQEGWYAERLKPMLVALDELIPWLKQWHNEIAPEFGERMGDYYEGFLLEELRQLDISRDELLSWEPSAATRRGGRRRRA